MKVTPSHIAESASTRAASTRAAGTDKRAFKSTLETAEITLRKGEEMQAVEGHAYAEITKGAREGMYVNTSGNVRHGEAFVLVEKRGVEYHIYGSGKDRLVVALKPAAGRKPEPDVDATKEKAPAEVELRKGEKAEPVEGHAYSEIVSGPRSGMYINTSGGARHGEAFVLVRKGDVNYHIYGSGEDRQIITVRRDDERA